MSYGSWREDLSSDPQHPCERKEEKKKKKKSCVIVSITPALGRMERQTDRQTDTHTHTHTHTHLIRLFLLNIPAAGKFVNWTYFIK